MTLHDLIPYYRKNVKVTCTDGDILTAKFFTIDDAIDNESGKDELVLEYEPKYRVDIPIDEIVSIEEVKETA